MSNKNLCIVQARAGSVRLPGKILMKVGKMTLLEYEIKRVRMAKKIDKIVVATTQNKEDNKTVALCKEIGIDCFRGSENDVLDRYCRCSLNYLGYENIIRITGDCPLIDPEIIDKVVGFFVKNKLDYASNIEKETYPDGMDIEIFKKSILEKAAENAKMASEREHVTLWIRNNKKIKKGNFASEVDFSHFRLTVDEMTDFEVISFLIKNSKITDGYLSYISLLTKNLNVLIKNIKIKRNEGLIKSLKNDYKVKLCKN